MLFCPKSCNILKVNLFPNLEITITVNQGDTVHHPHHGLGQVQSIRTRSFSGNSGARFAKIYFERDALTVWVREPDLADTVRPSIAAPRAEKILDHIRTWHGAVRTSWKARANANEKKLETGRAKSYAEVYKSLKRQQAKGKLSLTDRRQLKMARRFLSEELAAALGQPISQVREQMASAAAN